MQSPLPGNEAGRSRVLWNYRILDTPPEERFDDLVRVATYICGTPIGLVGLIDAGREWFKSRVGWDLSEIPREISFGTHTITQPDVLIVSDTLKDERFVRNQLATQAGVRFYAGAPLLTPEGYALGTLSVMDYVPRALTGVQTRILWALARQVMAHLEDRRDLGSNPERDSYERYRRFFESSVVGFYRTTLDGQLLDCNPAFVRIMGYVSREELLACHALEFYFSPSERQEFLEQCLTLGSLTNFASRLRRKDGSSVWVLENVETVPGRGGTPAMIEGTLVDISQQKSAETAHNKAQQALEDSETRHRSVFEGAVHGIYRGTLDGRFLDVNPALVAMLGYSSTEEVLKLSVSQDVFAEPEEGLRLLHKWQVTAEIEEEVQWKRRDQRLITVRLSGRVLRTENQRAAGLEVIAEDVTERRALE